MKKIFIGTLSSIILISLYMSQAFSSTLFFTTKDGRLFCEVDSYDGSYEECTLAETAGMKLEKAVFPSARLIDTPNEKICVEYSTQVDISLCQEEIDLMKKYLATKTGSTLSGVANTGTSLSGSTLFGVANTGTSLSGSTLSGAANTGIVIENPIHQQVQLITNKVGIGNQWIESIQSTYLACVPDYWSDNCMKEFQVITDMIAKVGVYSILVVVLLVIYIFIFWLSMLGHVISHTIPHKIIWFPVLLLLFFPGAILYYFFVKRPFAAVHLASLPKGERSFF